MKDWLQHAIDASNLCQSYIDIVSDKLFDLTDEQKETLKIEIEAVEVNGPEEAAAIDTCKASSQNYINAVNAHQAAENSMMNWLNWYTGVAPFDGSV